MNTPDETIAQLRAELIIREDQIAKLTAEHSASWETFYPTPLAEARGKLVQLEEDIRTITDNRNQWQKAADALEKELAERGQNDQLAAERFVALENAAWKLQDERDGLKSRLAAMQKHADALAGWLEDSNRHLLLLRDLVHLYDARLVELGDPPDRVYDKEHVEKIWHISLLLGFHEMQLAAYRAFTAEREKEKKQS